MKRSTVISTYLGFLTIALFLYSCEKEDFTPTSHNNMGGTKMDSSWVYDSTFTLPDHIPHGNSFGNDSTGGSNPGDTLGGGGWTPNDSIWFNPNTPPHGGWTPYDSTGGNNPGDTLGGGN